MEHSIAAMVEHDEKKGGVLEGRNKRMKSRTVKETGGRVKGRKCVREERK